MRESSREPSGSGIHVSSSSTVSVPLSDWVLSNILTLVSTAAFGTVSFNWTNLSLTSLDNLLESMEQWLFIFTSSFEIFGTKSFFLGLLKFVTERRAGFAWVRDFYHALTLRLHATLYKSIIEYACSMKSNAARWLHVEPNLKLNNFLEIMSCNFIHWKIFSHAVKQKVISNGHVIFLSGQILFFFFKKKKKQNYKFLNKFPRSNGEVAKCSENDLYDVS